MGSSESRSYFARAARASRGGAWRRARREPRQRVVVSEHRAGAMAVRAARRSSRARRGNGPRKPRALPGGGRHQPGVDRRRTPGLHPRSAGGGTRRRSATPTSPRRGPRPTTPPRRFHSSPLAPTSSRRAAISSPPRPPPAKRCDSPNAPTTIAERDRLAAPDKPGARLVDATSGSTSARQTTVRVSPAVRRRP
jgi:hypothetical protein